LKIQIPAIILALLFAVAAAVVAATRQHSRTDFAVVGGAMLGHSLPGFFVGILLILIFSYWLGVLPSYGAYSTRNPLWGSVAADGLWHMVLPIAMLAFFNTATLTLTCCGRISSPPRAPAACRSGASCWATRCATPSSRC
jgi:peptide/nickel transport system permease protein